MSTERRLTLERIADEAGVSVRTVQRVLSGSLKETRPSSIRRANAIRDIAARYRYLPNTAARAVRTGRFNTVALLSSFDPVRKVMFPGMLWALQAGLRRRDIQLITAQIPDHELADRKELPKFLREWTVDGLLVYHNRRMPQALIDAIDELGLPCIWLNVKQPADSVYPDDRGAAAKAAQVLIERGHREIALVSFSTGDHYSHIDRELGFREVMQRHQLNDRVVRFGRSVPMRERYQAAVEWLAGLEQRPTAMIAYEQRDAYPIFVAAQKLGIEVPKHLSLIAIHDSPADLVGVQIDSMVIPAQDLGRIGIELLMKKVEHPERRLDAKPLPFFYQAGDTVSDRL